MQFTAYEIRLGARVEPASRWRDWMNATRKRFANRCLPLNGFIRDVRSGVPAAVDRGWERHYFCGRTPGGEKAGQHQTVLRLAPFTGIENVSAVPPNRRDSVCPAGARKS
jgi:Family of unknown function (DUF6065)